MTTPATPPYPGGGPYLTMAVLCEQVIQAQDGRLTVVNMIDRITHSATGPEATDQMPPFTAGMKAVVMLKAGEARGRFAVRFQPEEPSGSRLQPMDMPVQFGGAADEGAALIVELTLQFQHEGLHWIDVVLVRAPGISGEEQLLTRIPLTVLYQPQRTPGAG